MILAGSIWGVIAFNMETAVDVEITRVKYETFNLPDKIINLGFMDSGKKVSILNL